MSALMVLGSTARADVVPDIGDTGAGSHTLTNIAITNQLNCQVLHFGDTSYEWYPPGQATEGNCGVHVALSEGVPTPTNTNYGPPCSNACFSATPWTAVSQSAITHPAQDTNQVVTVVTSGANGDLRLTETDTYHVGDEFYNTSVTLEQVGGVGGLSGNLYVAGDCFLQNDDHGFGYTTGGVFCRAGQNSTTPGARLEGFQPITSGSHYIEAFYHDVWTAIDSGNPLPDTCVCSSFVDNGAGLSWSFSILGTQTAPVNGNVRPAVNIGTSATFTWNTIVKPLALSTPTPTPTPTATVKAVVAPKLPPSGAQSPTAPAPAPGAPWLWLGVAAVVGAFGVGVARKLPRREL